ncbi:NUDCD3 family protein [Megaselia abdita]
MEHKHDNMLMEILRDSKSPPEFLNSVFGFLSRRTDFFLTYDEKSKIGLPAGIKNQIVFQALKKYENNSSDHIPFVSNEVEISTSEIDSFDDLTLLDTEKLQTKSSDKSNQTLPSFNASEYYNGAVYESYCWSQTDSDVEINVILPKNIKSSKDLALNVTSSMLLIKDRTSQSGVILEGEFKEKCQPDSLLWNFSNGKLQISLGIYLLTSIKKMY